MTSPSPPRSPSSRPMKFRMTPNRGAIPVPNRRRLSSGSKQQHTNSSSPLVGSSPPSSTLPRYPDKRGKITTRRRKSENQPNEETPAISDESSNSISPPQRHSSGMDTSLMMLHSSMKEDAESYEYLFDKDAVSDAKDENAWVSLITQMQRQHAEEKSRLKKDLESARQKTKTYKEQLRDNISERLNFLEGRVQQSQTYSGNADAGSRATVTTTSSHSIQDDDNRTHETAAFEVIYHEAGSFNDGMSPEELRKRIRELEEKLEKSSAAHKEEKKYLINQLEKAVAATNNGAMLTSQMQNLLHQVTNDVHRTYEIDMEKFSGDKKRLQDRIKEQEQKYTADKELWQTESAKLKDDSRRLLAERNKITRSLESREKELEQTRTQVADLERQVDLTTRQKIVAQRQAFRAQEQLDLQRQGQTIGQTKDPPLPMSGSAMTSRLERAIKERDEAQKDAEEAVQLLETCNSQLQKARSDAAERIRLAEEASYAEVERRIAEYRKTMEEDFKKSPMKHTPQAEMERRYRESIERRNELVARLKTLEEQHTADRGKWKLQLESSLAKVRQEYEGRLEAETERLKKEHESELQTWEEHVRKIEDEWENYVVEMKAQHDWGASESSKEVERLNIALQKSYKEENEKIVESTKAHYETVFTKWKNEEFSRWKENELSQLRAEQEGALRSKLLHEMEEKHKAEAEQLRKERELFQDEVKEIAKKLSALEVAQTKEVESWATKIHAMETEKEKALERLSESHKKQLSQLRKVLQEHEDDKQRMQKWNTDLQNQLKDAKKTHEDLEKSLQAAKKGKQDGEVRLRALQQRSRALESEKENSVKETNEWKKTSEKLEVYIKELMESEADATQKLQSQLKASKSEIANLKKQLDERFKECNVLTAEVKKLTELEQSFEKNKQENLQLQRKLDQSLVECEKIKVEASRQNTGLREEFELANRETECLLVELEESIEKTGKENEQLRDELEKAEKENLRMKTEARASVDKSGHDSEKLRLQLVESLEKAHREVEELKQARTELGMENETLKSLKAEMKCLHVGELEELRNDSERRMESTRNGHQEEIKAWSLRLDNVEREAQKRVESVESRFRDNMEDLKESYSRALEAAREEKEEIKTLHEKEIQLLQEQIAASDRQSKVLSDQTNILATSLEEVHAMHTNSSTHWEAELARLEATNEELKKEQDKPSPDSVLSSYCEKLDRYKLDVANLVDELRNGAAFAREEPSSGLDATELVEIRTSLEEMQHSIYEAVAELTLETETMIENKSQLQAVIDRSKEIVNSHGTIGAQQDKLMIEIASLRDLLSKVIESDGETGFASREKVRQEFLEEIARSEAALIACRVEVEHLKHQVSKESEMRMKAEEEIRTLNDQADAYGEELMNLQTINSQLEDALMNADGRRSPFEDRELTLRKTDTDESSSPMLEEAIALAQNLKDLVEGKGDEGKETDVMDLLESISDLIDQADRVDSSDDDAEKSRSGQSDIPSELDLPPGPRRHFPFKFDGVEVIRPKRKPDCRLDELTRRHEEPPRPVSSPLVGMDSSVAPSSETQLSVVVEQLYTRCELLERERTDMMEVTLDLLQSARRANEAELEAALATARRRSAEELLKLKEENQKSMWRLYRKLCGDCQTDLAEGDKR